MEKGPAKESETLGYRRAERDFIGHIYKGYQSWQNGRDCLSGKA